MTKLNSALPKGEANGLDAIARDLIDNPDQVQVLLMLVDCKQVTTDMDTGDVIPTARIRRVEPIRHDKQRVMLMLRRAMEERTGKTVLPFDLEEDLRGVLGGLEGDEA